MISKNFKYSEFERSDTARMYGIDNSIPEELKPRIKALVDNVLQPLRDVWGAMPINSGYRCRELNEKVGGVETSQHCFDEETEILTIDGWKHYNEINTNDSVFSYNIEKDIIEPTSIDKIIIKKYDGELLRLSNKQLEVLTTDKHRMLVRYPSHKYVRRNTKNITEAGQKYFDSLKTNNDKWHIELAEEVFGKRRIFKCAGNSVAWAYGDLLFYKMCMAVIADGYFCHKKSCNGIGVGFRFKKERKCLQIEKLLGELGWYFTKNLDANGVWNYYLRFEYGNKIFNTIGENKHIPNDVLSMGSNFIKELVLYYALYDGCYDKRENHNNINISTVIKHNADILQAMCAISNMRCVCTKKPERTYNIKRETGIAKEIYTLSINTLRSDSKAKEDSYTKQKYEGVVWCVNNKNTTLIVRRNGKVSIQGNCTAEAADIRCSNPLKLAQLAKDLGLPFDQIGLYPTFVHISHKYKGKQRGHIFYHKSYKGGKVK